MSHDERIARLRACIERTLKERAKVERELAELDEALRATLSEFMDLAAPRGGR